MIESDGLKYNIKCKFKDEIDRNFIFFHFQGKGTVRTFFLVGKENFDKELPNLKLAAPLAEHEFK